MQRLTFLNTRENKKMLEELKEIYGFSAKLEGALLISPKQKLYLLTKDFELTSNEKESVKEDGFYIIKFNQDFLGCAKIRQGKAHNLVTKSRRLKVLNR